MARLGLFLPLFIILASGCASLSAPPPEHDPYERFNRTVYKFNDTLDRAVLKPVAQGYEKVVPQPIDDGVTNFFSNIDDVVVTLNDLLQGKFRQAGSDLSRLVWNSTVGIGGLFDVASQLGLPKHNEDFGQTLGAWGVEPGPYIVLPLLGPSTFRDTVALPADWYSDPLYYYYAVDKSGYWQLRSLDTIDTRAGLLRASRLIEQAALDEYVFLREAYLQRRQNLVYDGNPPLPDFDLFDEELDEETPPAQPAPAETPPATPAP